MHPFRSAACIITGGLVPLLVFHYAAPALGSTGTSTSTSSAGWTAYPVGTIYDNDQCRDISNPVNQSIASCEALCDHTPDCSAINAFIKGATGPCALRACACGSHEIPEGSSPSFQAFSRDSCVSANVTGFAKVFGNDMVLQRAPLQARLFGTAGPLSKVRVSLIKEGAPASSAVNTCTATADKEGHWTCMLPATPAGGPYTISAGSMHFTGRGGGDDPQGQVLTGVLFGDVFICSGQSNMVETVQLVNNATREIAAAANFPWIRLAVVAQGHASDPARDTSLVLPWQKPSPAAFPNGSWTFFSATCWFTARDLTHALGNGVPLGLIDSAVGGTPIEMWTPGLPGGASLYNAMVAPLTGLAIKAILWYQGENNSFKPSKWITYATQFPAMIQLWRTAWANTTGIQSLGSVPFGFVQIGPRDCLPCADHQGPAGTFYGGVRWSQTGFLYSVPNTLMPSTFMAVTADLAEGYSPVLNLQAGCVHYGNKQDVGVRLALGVRRAVYGHAVASNGPRVVGVSATAASVVLTMAADGGEGLDVRNTSGFELSADGATYLAAEITQHTNTTVTLATPSGWREAEQTAVSLRYIMHDTPCVNKTCALYGLESGLPSPPLVANLPGHAGADPVGWNMTQ